jgi:hypothetical protein
MMDLGNFPDEAAKAEEEFLAAHPEGDRDSFAAGWSAAFDLVWGPFCGCLR